MNKVLFLIEKTLMTLGNGALWLFGRVRQLELSDIDLRKLDLTRKYDDDFSIADDIHPRDHLMLYIITAFFVIFFGWAAFFSIDEVARGEGKVVTSSQSQIIQNLEGGIIDDILVKEGDMVTEGQVLVQMRNIQAKSEFGASMQKYLGIYATVTRLQAEAEGADTVTFPAEIVSGSPESVKAEQEAFDANKRQRRSQEEVLTQQKNQKEQEVSELQRRIEDSSRLLRLAQDEKAMIAPMVSKGAASKMELLQVERQIAQQQSEQNSLRLALPRAKSAVKEFTERLTEMQNSIKADAQKQLAEKTVELNTIKETLGAYEDRSARTEIKSPVNGRVQAIKIKTIGGVIKPGEPMMEIIPSGEQLVFEAKIKPSDIAFVHKGQAAVVRISAFDFSIYGALDGSVDDISPDSITTDRGESFYRVRVKTAKDALYKGTEEHKIIPGMMGTVDIVTGRKTIMKYLLKPFNKATQEALSER